MLVSEDERDLFFDDARPVVLDTDFVPIGSLVNRRKKAVLPALRERQALVDSLTRIVAQLGLQRRAKPVMELTEYLARKAEQKAAAEPPDAS